MSAIYKPVVGSFCKRTFGKLVTQKVHDREVKKRISKCEKLDRIIAVKTQELQFAEENIKAQSEVTESYCKTIEEKTAQANAVIQEQLILQQQMKAEAEQIRDEMENFKIEIANDEVLLTKYENYKRLIECMGVTPIAFNKSSDTDAEQKIQDDCQELYDVMLALKEGVVRLLKSTADKTALYCGVRRLFDATMSEVNAEQGEITSKVDKISRRLENARFNKRYYTHALKVYATLDTEKINEDFMLNLLGAKVATLYQAIVRRGQTSLTDLDMLLAIEKRILMLLERLEKSPEEMKKILKSIMHERRKRMIQEEKLRLEREKEMERQKRCDQRLSRKMMQNGKKLMRKNKYGSEDAKVHGMESFDLIWESMSEERSIIHIDTWEDWEIEMELARRQARCTNTEKTQQEERSQREPKCKEPKSIPKSTRCQRTSSPSARVTCRDKAATVCRRTCVHGQKTIEEKKERTLPIRNKETRLPPIIKTCNVAKPTTRGPSSNVSETKSKVEYTRLPPIANTRKAAQHSNGASTPSMGKSSDLSAVTRKPRWNISQPKPKKPEQQQNLKNLEVACKTTKSTHPEHTSGSSAKVTCDKAATVSQRTCVHGKEKEEITLPIRNQETSNNQNNVGKTRLPAIIKTRDAAKASSENESCDLPAVKTKPRLRVTWGEPTYVELQPSPDEFTSEDNENPEPEHTSEPVVCEMRNDLAATCSLPEIETESAAKNKTRSPTSSASEAKNKVGYTRLPPIAKTVKAAKDSSGAPTSSLGKSRDLSAGTQKPLLRTSSAKPLNTKQQKQKTGANLKKT